MLQALKRKKERLLLHLRTPWVRFRVDIPVLIICRDRLASLVDLVQWLEDEGMTNIYLLDNDSTYPPLLDYLNTSPRRVLRLDNSAGHLAPWLPEIQTEIVRGRPFIVTDCDVVPDSGAHGAVRFFAQQLNKHLNILKIGFGLQIDDLPQRYDKRDQVIAWESKYWEREDAPGLFRADLDTTFALYRANTPYCLRPALRTGGRYVARHTPWYAHSTNPTAEDLFYNARARADVTNWGVDGSGHG